MGAEQSDKSPDGRWFRRMAILFFILVPVVIIAGIMTVRYVSAQKALADRETVPMTADGQAEAARPNDNPGDSPTHGADRESSGDTTGSRETAEIDIPVSPEETSGNFTLPEGAELEQAALPEITELFLGYFEAKLSGDAEAANRYFTGGEAADPEEEGRRLLWSLEYIEDYREISCRSVPGPEEDSFVVYVYYKIKFHQSQVPAPSLSAAYVKKDGDGIYRIFDGFRDEGLKIYMEQVEELESVKELARQVQDEFAQALAEDENLAALYSIAMAGPGSGQETSGGPEDTETGETES